MNTKTFFNSKNKLMAIVLLGLFIFLISCKKLNLGPNNQNELKATVRFISGEIININVTKESAFMQCGFGFSISNQQGIDYPGLSLQTFDGFNCITTPGTYYSPGFLCTFSREGAQPDLYSNTSATNPGSITFTSFSDSYVECFFSTTCKYGANDSVVINGTFKGNLDQQINHTSLF